MKQKPDWVVYPKDLPEQVKKFMKPSLTGGRQYTRPRLSNGRWLMNLGYTSEVILLPDQDA